MNISQKYGNPAYVIGCFIASDESEEFVRCKNCYDDYETSGRKNSSGPASVEASKRGSAISVDLTKQKLSNNKSRDHEKYIDADIPSTESGNRRVIENYGGDRYSSKAFNIGPKLTFFEL